MVFLFLNLLLGCGSDSEETKESAAPEVAEEASASTPSSSVPAEAVVAENSAVDQPVPDVPSERTTLESTDNSKSPYMDSFATSYNFHDGNGILQIRISNDPTTPAAKMATDHLVLAQDWIGSVRWHPQKMKQCIFEFHIPVRSLNPDPPELRRLAGLDPITQGERDKIKTHLLTKEQLWADKYPMIEFAADKCRVKGDKVRLLGNLKIRGVRHQVETYVDVKLKDGMQVTGSLKIKHSDFGFEPFRGFMGAVANKDLMQIDIILDSRGI